MNGDRDSEGQKWLGLAFETYGPAGLAEMAYALGLQRRDMSMRPAAAPRRAGPPGKGWTATQGSDTKDAWRQPVRMPAMCPPRKPIGDSRWKPYEGNPWWFHCGYKGFLENRRPSQSQPIAECFYDEDGRLVDQNHPHAGCRGTPDQYAADDWWRHTWDDKGGVKAEGWDSFWEGRWRDLDELLGW